MTPQVRYQQRMKAEGRCVSCGQTHKDCMSRCRRCQGRQNQKCRLRRAHAKRHGRCQECFAGFLGPARYSRCLPCRQRIAKRAAKYYATVAKARYRAKMARVRATLDEMKAKRAA